jgi:DNA polymerase-3 subunit beta
VAILLPPGDEATGALDGDGADLTASRGATLRVSATAQQIGDNATDVDAQVTGDPIGISLNSVYLAEVLGVLRADQVSLQFDGPLSPAIIRGIGLEGYVHVIMPMHSVA